MSSKFKKNTRLVMPARRFSGGPGPIYKVGLAQWFLSIFLVLLTAGYLHAAEPGLPFTEDFSDTNLKDEIKTNANWSTAEQEVYLAWRKQLYGAMSDPKTYEIGTDSRSTLSIALGDVDGDGDLDVVVGGRPNKLYLNNGSEIPFFLVESKIIGSEADDASAIALGDMEGDGDLDVVTGDKLYLNNGTADPFNGVSGTAIGVNMDGPSTVALGDMDGDGDLDLVVGFSDQANELYINNGTDNPFLGVIAKSIGSASEFTHAMAIGDVDGDEDIDLVVTSGDYEVNRIYLNNGSTDPFSGVSSMNIGTETDRTLDVALGDVDGDGDVDLVVGNSSDDKVYFNNGTDNPFFGVNGTFIHNAYGFTWTIALGDVDGDGDIDLVTEDSDPHCTLYLNNGTANPFFAATRVDIAPVMENPRKIALGDMDGDGDLDVVAGNYAHEDMLYLNNGTENPFNGVIGSVITDTSFNDTVDLGDIDRDGYLDVVVGKVYSPHKLYLNNGTDDPFNDVSGTDIGADSDQTYSITLGDVDSDGDLDIVAGNRGQTNKLYLNNGTATPFLGINGTNIGSDTDATIDIALGDVDKDGDLDVVAGNSGQTNKLYLNNGTPNPFSGISGTTISEDSDLTSDVELVDVDGDDDLDVVTANAYQAKLYLNNGTSNPFNGVSGTNIGADSTWYGSGIAMGDVDGDGDIDLVLGDNQYENRLYLNNGTADPFGDVSGKDIGQEEDWTHYVALGDVDGDGDLDVVAINYAQTNKLYLNNGTSDPFNGINGMDIGPYSDGNRDIALGDVDRDGSLDLVLITGTFPTLYLNNGNVDLCTLCFDTSHGLIASIEVDTEAINNISNATLTHSDTLAANTNIDYFLSNNGGERFYQVYHGQEFIFPTQGNDLRWKAELHSLSPALTPRIQQISITTRNIASEATAGGTLAYTEDDLATAIDQGITVTDIDNVNLESAKISISNGYQNGEDVLAFTDANGITTESWNVGTGTLTLTGTSTVENYQAALRSITYENTNLGNPSIEERTITFVVNDGELDSSPVTSAVTITRTNDPPQITAHDPDPANIVQSETIAISINTPPAPPSGHIYLTVDDPDNVPNDLSLIVQTGINYSNQENTITPVEGFFGELIVPLIVYDGNDYGEVYDLSIQVNDVTDPTVSLVVVQVGGLSVDVTFSEPMGTGVETPANYAISGGGQGTLSNHPDSVVYLFENIYRLTWTDGEMFDGGDITITTSDIYDAAGRLIGTPNSATDSGGGIGTAPTTTATPPGGPPYNTKQTVSLSCDDGAGSGCDAIYYSTDGSAPSTQYVDPISIDQFTELKLSHTVILLQYQARSQKRPMQQTKG
jgi:hypothetical protein